MDERLLEVEIKLAFLEKTVADLDEVLRDTRDALERALRELGTLREQVTPGGKFDPNEEVPPHY